MYDMSELGLTETTQLGADLRELGLGHASLEEASQVVARGLVNAFVRAGRSDVVLARCYKTHPLAALPTDLGSFARGVFPGQSLDDDTQCLTLLGSFGDEPAWQSRRTSGSHKAIPLFSEKTVESLPMVARLTLALGLDPSHVVRPDPELLIEKDREGFNVFHVEHASGSPYIPAQEAFVKRYGVRSVVGFGFVLPPASVFATILFCRAHVTPDTAELFKTLALGLKSALLPLSDRPAFAAR